MKGFAKFTILAYVGTYFAIGSAWILTLVNYFATGWFSVYLDRGYLPSWEVFTFVLFVFTGLSGFVFIIYRYRTRESQLLHATVEVLTWAPLLLIFFSGISLHLSQAILCYLCSINMQWGATAKELEDSNFWQELPMIAKKFWKMYALMTFFAIVMIALAFFVPEAYRIHTAQYYAWVPMLSMVAGHMLVPIALNPQLMNFAY